MLKYYPLTTIEGIDLFIRLVHSFDEPMICMKIDEEMIPITISSNEFEFHTDEYFLHMNNLNEYIEYGCPILDELGETVPLSFFHKLTLKPEYVEIVDKYWEEHVEYVRELKRK